jgi:hypothetical protein
MHMFTTKYIHCENLKKYANTLCGHNAELKYLTAADTYRATELWNATSWKVAGLISDEAILFFNWPNHSSRTVALGSTQHLTEMYTRNLPGDNMWEPRRLTTLWASTACYRDTFFLPEFWKVKSVHVLVHSNLKP